MYTYMYIYIDIYICIYIFRPDGYLGFCADFRFLLLVNSCGAQAEVDAVLQRVNSNTDLLLNQMSQVFFYFSITLEPKVE